jgi:hypothetical protein
MDRRLAVFNTSGASATSTGDEDSGNLRLSGDAILRVKIAETAQLVCARCYNSHNG